MITGRLYPNFEKIDNRIEGTLPRDTLAEIEVLEDIQEREEEAADGE